MMKLATYPEYKNAGVSWVGSIPVHWPEKRAKYYFKEIDERSQTGDEEEILVHIREATSTIDQAINRAHREIELMREYRTRLISDVVTGQVDVRGIEVPEVAEEELLALDEDTAESDDVIDDEGDMDETD